MSDVYLYSVPSDVDADDVRLRDPTGFRAASGSAPLSFVGVITAAGEATASEGEDTRRSGGVIYEYVSKRKKAPKRIRRLADELEDAYERLLKRVEEIAAPVEAVEAVAEVQALVEPFAAAPEPAPYQVDWAEVVASQQRIAAIDAAIERALAQLQAIEEEDDEMVLLLAA